VKRIWVASALIAATAFGCGGGGGGGADKSALIDKMAKESGIPKEQAKCIVDALDSKIDLNKLANAKSESDMSEKDQQAIIDATMKCIGITIPTTGG